MILPTAELILATAALLVSLWCAVGLMAARSRWTGDVRELRESLLQCREDVQAGAEKALREVALTSAGNAVEPLSDPGRLSRSARARALKMVRAGVPPDSAASTLEMPRRDVALLSRVAAILSQ